MSLARASDMWNSTRLCLDRRQRHGDDVPASGPIPGSLQSIPEANRAPRNRGAT